jgi:Na+/melibiose symporter-like transporter
VAPGPAALFVVLAVYGSAFALTNLAMNIEVDRREAVEGQRFMNRCHGVASAGLLVTSLLGAALRGAGVPASLHLIAMAPVAAAAALALILPLKPAPPRRHTGARRRRSVALPTAMTFLLVGFGISAFLLEGAARTWSIIYMRDSFVSPDWLESLALTVFLAFMAVERLVADRFTERFGPPMVARVLMAIAAAGLMLIALAPTPLLGLLGFALTGLGTSAIYPLTLSAAARLPDRPSSENVAAVTMVGSIAVLAAPAVLGSIATHYGIRLTFAVLIPATMLSFALAWVLRARKIE